MNRSFFLKTKYMIGVGFKYAPSPHGYQSTHRQIYKEDDTPSPHGYQSTHRQIYNEDDIWHEGCNMG